MPRFLLGSLHLHSCPAVSWDEQLVADYRKWSVMKRVPAPEREYWPEPCSNGSGTGDVLVNSPSLVKFQHRHHTRHTV